MASANGERICIELRSFDARDTLVMPRDVSHARAIAQAIEHVTGKSIDRRGARIGFLAADRAKREFVDSWNEDEVNGDRYWIAVNRRYAEALGFTISDAQGLDIHKVIEADVGRFTLSARRKKFVRAICKGQSRKQRKRRSRYVRNIVWTNSSSEATETLLAAHGIRELFHSICAPDNLEGASKPTRRAVDQVCARYSVQPKQILHIGNSPVHDLRLVRWGVHVVIIAEQSQVEMAKGEFADLERRGLIPAGTVFFATSKLQTAKEWISQHFVAADRQLGLFKDDK